MKQLLLAIILSTALSGCYYDNVDELHPQVATCDTTGTISFSADISPIMLHSCGSSDLACHNGNASQSGYGLGTYDDVMFTIDDSGDFLETITHSPSISSTKWMPKNSGSKIDACSIEKITAWLNRGKLNN
jgi:hypothetical protein